MGDDFWVFNTAVYGKMYSVPLILLSSVLSRQSFDHKVDGQAHL